MAETPAPEHRATADLIGGDRPFPIPHPPLPRPVPPPPIPPFQPASYTFRLVSMQVLNTRSAHLDSDKASLTVAVGPNGAPTTVIKDLGDVNNGTFPIGLSIGPILISDPNIGVAMNYLILNSGHQSRRRQQDPHRRRLRARLGRREGRHLSRQGRGRRRDRFGPDAGGRQRPGADRRLAGRRADRLLTADCNGPVASEQPAFKGSQLWANTARGAYTHTTYHPGIDSASGCGSNSIYTATWSISR